MKRLPELGEPHGGTERSEAELLKHLEQQLLALPDEAFSRLQYLQPQIGCFNRCSFCSQSAGKEIWQFTPKSLELLVEAVKRAATKKFPERAAHNNPLIAFDRPEHKAGVVYPYLDNDVGSYPHLDTFIELLANRLNVKTRISTVGYSRKNGALQAMHQRIARYQAQQIDGIRFSFTPYTYGFTAAGEHAGDTSRVEYIQDFSNMLRTYRPLIETNGIGRDKACVELRFKPAIFLENEGVTESVVAGYYVIKSGSYVVICEKSLETARVSDIDGRTPIFNRPPVKAKLLQSDSFNSPEWKESVETYLNASTNFVKGAILSSKVEVYKLENSEGPYFVLNPHFKESGHYTAIQLYPKTDKRKAGGVMDSTRFFLNTLLDYKQSKGLGRRDKFPDATWNDVSAVLALLLEQAKALHQSNSKLGDHLLRQVYPMIEAYANALIMANYPAHLFFDRDFTVDTGQIVNQGRALHEFKGLASTIDLPITANEEKGYGEKSFSTQRGFIWRWSPSPYGSEQMNHSSLGRKNRTNTEGSGLVVSQLDWHDLMPFLRDGSPLPQIEIEGLLLEKVHLRSATKNALYPGVKKEENDDK